MKVLHVIQMFAENEGFGINAEANVNNVTRWFGKCTIKKGQNYPKTAWRNEWDQYAIYDNDELPFELIWTWQNIDKYSEEMLASADIILAPYDQPETRILIWEIVK